MNPDFRDLLAAFCAHDVRFLIVGGYAVAFHARPRFTKDLDLWVDPAWENAERVFAALKEFGAPLEQVSATDFTDAEAVYQVGIAPNRVDVLTALSGLSFSDAWSHRVRASYAGIGVAYLSRTDLITNKRAAGRPQDLIDADLLESTAS